MPAETKTSSPFDLRWRQIYGRMAAIGAVGGAYKLGDPALHGLTGLSAHAFGAAAGLLIYLVSTYAIRHLRWKALGLFAGPLFAIGSFQDFIDYRTPGTGWRLLGLAIAGAAGGALACEAFTRIERWRRDRRRTWRPRHLPSNERQP